MKTMLANLFKRQSRRHPAGNPGEDIFLVKSPHKLILAENVSCQREDGTVVLELSLRNLGDEIKTYGIKVINNFDPEGNEHEYEFTFGKSAPSSGRMVSYTLPYNIPIKIRIRFFNVGPQVSNLAQVKLAGIAVKSRRKTRGYDPSGSILLRNIPIHGNESPAV